MEVGPTNRAGHYLDDGIAAVLNFWIRNRLARVSAGHLNPTKKDIPYDFDHASLPS
jgi:hypothetical protein